MTVINTTDDNRVIKTPSFGSDYAFGLYSRRNTAGTDRSPADVAAGKYPDNPYSGSRTTEFWGDYQYMATSFGVESGPYTSANPGPGINYTPPAWDANDDIKLLSDLADKYRGADWNAGIFVAELGKTVDSVAFRVKTLASAVAKVKRGNLGGALRDLNSKPRRRGRDQVPVPANPMELWLEIRYAWRPLLKDIFDLSKSIQNLDAPRKKVFKVRNSKPGVVSSTTTALIVWGEGKYSKQIIARVAERYPSFPEYLGLTNPLAIAWEVMPFSFVADWFIPIGSYVGARTTLHGMEGIFVATTYDWHRGSVVGLQDEPGTPMFNIRRIQNTRTGFRHQMTINRIVTDHLDMPLPEFKNPLGNNPGTRLLDALALLRNVVSR